MIPSPSVCYHTWYFPSSRKVCSGKSRNTTHGSSIPVFGRTDIWAVHFCLPWAEALASCSSWLNVASTRATFVVGGFSCFLPLRVAFPSLSFSIPEDR